MNEAIKWLISQPWGDIIVSLFGMLITALLSLALLALVLAVIGAVLLSLVALAVNIVEQHRGDQK